MEYYPEKLLPRESVGWLVRLVVFPIRIPFYNQPFGQDHNPVIYSILCKSFLDNFSSFRHKIRHEFSALCAIAAKMRRICGEGSQKGFA